MSILSKAVNEWVGEYVKDRSEVSIAAATDAFMAEFDGTEVMRGVIETVLRPAIYTLVQVKIATTRCLGERPKLTIVGPNQEIINARTRRWLGFMETVAVGRTVRLMEMTRADLLEAAVLRERSARRDLALATLWRNLAHGLGDGQKVGDRYKPQEIDALYEGEQPAVAAAAAD